MSGVAESARIGALLTRNGIMDSPKKLVWREWIIEAGASVYVLGDASSSSAGPSLNHYGEAALVRRLQGQRTIFRVAFASVILVAGAVSFFGAMR